MFFYFGMGSVGYWKESSGRVVRKFCRQKITHKFPHFYQLHDQIHCERELKNVGKHKLYFPRKNESKKRTCHVEDTAPIMCFMDLSQFAVAKNRAKTGVLVKKMQIGSAIIGRLFFAHQAPPPLGHQAPASDKNKKNATPTTRGAPGA